MFVRWCSRFPWPACQDPSASVSRMHACHFKSWLDLIIVPIFWNNLTDLLISMLKTNCCWKRWQSWHDKNNEVVHCTSNWFPIFVGQWGSVTFCNSNGFPCFEESISCDRTAGVSSSNRTVTNRSKSWTKTRASSFICNVPITASTAKRFLDLLCKVSVKIWAYSHLLSIVFLARFHATLLSQSACREVSSSVHSSKPGAQGFRSWGSPFWIMPPDCPLRE